MDSLAFKKLEKFKADTDLWLAKDQSAFIQNSSLCVPVLVSDKVKISFWTL